MHLGPRWMDRNWEKKDHEVEIATTTLPDAISNTKKLNKGNNGECPFIYSQLGKLDPKKIYWNEEKEIYVHESGMCFDSILRKYTSP